MQIAVRPLRASSLLAVAALLGLGGCPGDDGPAATTSGGTTSGETTQSSTTQGSTTPGSTTPGGSTVAVDGSETSASTGEGADESSSSGSASDGGSSSDGGMAMCGNGVVEGVEACDDGGESEACNADCTVASCGDGTVNAAAGEACDEGAMTASCDDDCTLAECQDGTLNPAAGEICDDDTQTATCDLDCTPAECGDAYPNGLAGEQCDDGVESAFCNADCTLAACGDGQINVAAGEQCDDGDQTSTCDGDCTIAQCGDGYANGAAGEQCDDGNLMPGDGCDDVCHVEVGLSDCAAPFTTLSLAPSGLMVQCDDPTNGTCEQDMETMCPPGWGLCSRLQHINRNAGWNVAVGGGGTVAVGEIYCRQGAGTGAGHYTLGPYDGVTSLADDPPINCGYGSSRSSCPSGFGCNELTVSAICCFPTPTCGNGVVDSIEEECDDGNANDDDDCLNSCSWRVPVAHGIPGVGC